MAKCKWCNRKQTGPVEHPVIFCTTCLPKGNKDYKELVRRLGARDLNPE